MKLIGLTGGIASGKTTAADILRRLGVHVIDADAVARQVVAPGTAGLYAVTERFGERVIADDGQLDRAALGAIVMAEPEEKAALEAITHPLIQEAIAQRIQDRAMAGDPAVVVEAALLVETGSWRLYDQLWVVRTSRSTQIQRLAARKGCDEATAIQWIDNQLPIDQKVRHAHVVIDNDSDLNALEAQVHHAWMDFIQAPPQ